MAYMSQENKAKLAPQIKAVLAKHNMKGTISVRHNMTLVVKVKANKEVMDLEPHGVNVYWIDTHYEDKPKECSFLNELYTATMKGNHNNSDVMTDYFDVGWYVDIEIVE